MERESAPRRTILFGLAIFFCCIGLPAWAQKVVPFTYDSDKRTAPKTPGQMRIDTITALLEKKGYHRLPGERYFNANGAAIPFNAPSGQHAVVAAPGEGCTGGLLEVEDPAGRKRLRGQPIGPGLVAYLNNPRDTDVMIWLKANSPLCVIYLLGYQR